jgi:hypothetical protein
MEVTILMRDQQEFTLDKNISKLFLLAFFISFLLSLAYLVCDEF